LARAKYEAEAILLLDASSDASGLLALAQGADFLSNLSQSFGRSSSGHTYKGIVESRSLLTAVLNNQTTGQGSRSLLGVFSKNESSREEQLENGIRRLRNAVKTEYDAKSSLLTITVRHRDPNVAADVANHIVAELREFNATVRMSRATDAVHFVEARLTESSKELAAAEGRFVTFRESNARIGNSPKLLLQEKRIEREVRLSEEIFALLAREREMARIQEKKESPVFTVLDTALPPVRRSGLPPLFAAALGGTIAGAGGLFFGMVQGVTSMLSRSASSREV
jgi:uncharacterized protein involved in exopolysaccharide biosynthesis